MTLQTKVRRLFNEADSKAGWVYRVSLILMIATLCVTFVMDTYPISDRTRTIISWIDFICALLFLIDYLVRFWSENFSIRYLFTPLAIVDLIAILPLFLSGHWQFVRVLRLLRILRLLRVLQRSKPKGWLATEFHLRLATILCTLFCIVFISAGMIYDLEHAHPGSQILTFFDALYFSIVSMTTVGYGDIVPISTEGRAVTLLMISSGMVLIPLQLTQLFRYLVRSSGKDERECERCFYRWHDQDAHYCKMCGKKMGR